MSALAVTSSHEDACDTPEARLMLAVLEEALATFRRGLTSQVPLERQRYREVEAWLRCTDSDSPFAFESICWTLRMDPDYVRSGFYQVKCAMVVGTRLRRGRKLRRERIHARRVWKGRIG